MWMRLAIIVMLLGVQAAGADVQRAMTFEPGTYQGPGYITQFGVDGRWTTNQGAVSGRFGIEDGIMFFTTEPAPCPKERVRYRFMPTSEGFRLHFLEDSCGRSHQMEDLVFVRKASIAK